MYQELIRPLAWVWMGIVIGVSFVATPIKFTVDSLTRPVALDVGRATFNALGYLEWALAVVLVALMWRAISTGRPPTPRTRVVAGVIIAVVVVQALWLVPALDARVASIIAGVEPPASHLHNLYGGAELIKVAALGLVGFWAVPTASLPTSPSASQSVTSRRSKTTALAIETTAP